jgi:dipeptidyl aminopeptidase/acylaminoacyl peptidase
MCKLLAILLVLSPLVHAADPPVVKELTINGNQFAAYVLPVGNEDRIVIRRLDPRDIAEYSLLSSDSEQGGHIEKIQWSPKGKYLVFTTSSSGGHSPWHFKTYIFSTERWEFLGLDDAVAAVTSPDFSFTDQTHLSIEMLKTQTSPMDDTTTRLIDMESLPWKSPKKKETEEEANP